MDTLFNAAPKSWARLTAQARQAVPPGEVDVRYQVRAALEAARAVPAARERSLLDEIAALARLRPMRWALACGSVGAALTLWAGLDAATGLGIVLDTFYAFIL